MDNNYKNIDRHLAIPHKLQNNIIYKEIKQKDLNIQILVKNKTLNGGFVSTPIIANINDEIEVKVILKNMSNQKLNMSNIEINTVSGILQKVGYPVINSGFITQLNDHMQIISSLESNFIIVARFTFKIQNIGYINFQISGFYNFQLNPNDTIYISKYYLRNIQVVRNSIVCNNNSQNSFTTMLDGIINNNLSNTVLLNIVSYNGLKGDIFVRNRTINGEFTNNQMVIDLNSDIEFKIVFTNVSEVTLYNPSITFKIDEAYLQVMGNVITNIGTAIWKNNNILSWTNITYLDPKYTIYAIGTLKTIKTGNTYFLLNGSYSVCSDGSNIRNLNEITSNLEIVTNSITVENNSQNQFQLASINNENSSNGIFLDIVPNILDRLKIEVLVRNKSLNGEFSNNSIIIDKASNIEFKIIITNISNQAENLYNTLVNFNFNTEYLQAIETPTASLGSAVWENNNVLAWNIPFLGINDTGYVTGTFKTLNIGIPTLSLNDYYSLIPDGSNRRESTSNVPSVEIVVSEIKIQKFQRIASAQGEFTSDNIEVINGEIIEFKFIVINISTKNVYNFKINDKLSNNLSCIKSSILGGGIWSDVGSSVVNGKTVGGTIEWNKDIIVPKENLMLYFQAEVVS